MKHFKTIISIMVLSLILVPFLSFAQGNQSGQKGIHEAGTGIENSELKEAGQGIGQGLETQNTTSLQNKGEEQQNQGIGQQIKTIAQNQNQNQKEIETTLEHVKNNRGNAVWRFFFGPNKYIYMAENKLATHAEKLEEVRELASKIKNEDDAKTLEEQIEIMEQAKTELAEEIKKENKGFSLFGWLNKLLSK